MTDPTTPADPVLLPSLPSQKMVSEMRLRMPAGIDYETQLSKKAMDVFIVFTRSRNALKAIRPKNWRVTAAEQVSQGWIFILRKHQVPTVGHEHLPTEELAELHAIIQAIAYERATAEGDRT